MSGSGKCSYLVANENAVVGLLFIRIPGGEEKYSHAGRKTTFWNVDRLVSGSKPPDLVMV